MANVNADEGTVGYFRIGPQDGADAGKWWVWDVEIFDPFLRRGYGSDAMGLADREAESDGAVELGLHVFGYNAAARKLYESMGYEPTSIRMSKPL